ncbi:MAG: heme A synthase [Chitinophagaceae bacterium]|nr:MAG: heme A synthase [Chitinophagaceae bacterium]
MKDSTPDNRNRRFRLWVKTSLILVYCVILAGALVRMTGSGMGCPDWPKCFGYYIPPTDVEQLTWRPGKTFEEGQVIIKDQALWVASRDIKSTQQYVASDWRAYTRHDYAIFNPVHTWIEYLNRLCGALAGIAVFVMAVLSLRDARRKPSITVLSWLSVFLMGFQAWLGATVVYSVLNPVKITTHMIVALLIVAILIYIRHLASAEKKQKITDGKLKWLAWLTLTLGMIQLVAGTQLRQYVDERVRLFGDHEMDQVLIDPGFSFYFHRSFSIAVLLASFFLYRRSRQINMGTNSARTVLVLLVLEAATGIAMAYLDFPFGTQAAHLAIATILFGYLFQLLLQTGKRQL